FLIGSWAQCVVNDDDHRIAVLTPATATGSSMPGAGHGSPAATRMKKYAVKKAPKTITSEMMKSSIHSSWGSTRELRLAGGGPWWTCSAPVVWAVLAASIVPPQAAVVAAVVVGRSTTTCSTGTPVAPRTRSIRLARSQPERSPGSVEITTASTRKSSSALTVAV